MRALWNRLVALLDYWLPSDEQLEADTPELRAFYNRIEAGRATRSQGYVEKINRRTS